MKPSFLSALLLCVLFFGTAGVVRAQEPEQGQDDGGDDSRVSRPFRGLFGLADEGRTGLDLSMSLYGAYDENLAATLVGGAVRDPRYQESGAFGGANAQLGYSWRGERAAFSAYAGSGGNYYPDQQRSWTHAHSAGIGFSRPIGRRNTFGASQTVGYAPYFVFTLFPAAPTLDEQPVAPPTGVNPDFSISELSTLRYATSVNFGRRLSRRSTVDFYYGFGGTSFETLRDDHRTHRGGVRFRRQITGELGLRLGYGYRTTQFASPTIGDAENRRGRSHDLDVGVDYAKALSVSRRTRITFGTGSSIVVQESASGGPDAPSGRDTRFFAAGNFTLTREIGRTWAFALNYARAATFSDVLLEPVLSDSVTADLRGLLGRYDDLSFVASLSSGDVGFSGQDNRYATYQGSVRWRRALSRHMAIYANYFYYHYDFGAAVDLPAGFVRDLDRHGVRIGLQAWVPLLRR